MGSLKQAQLLVVDFTKEDLKPGSNCWSLTCKQIRSALYQNHISGLEIRARDGEWIAFEFPPKSFVVVAGDACKAWSNDRVLSPNHKVTMDADGKETRYTIALFTFLRKMVEVPEELVDEEPTAV